jgi:2-haloacid dehalogenase
MSQTVNTVIFDIGNVLIEWDPEHLYRKLIPDDGFRAKFLSEICSMEWNLQQDLGRTWEEAIKERTTLYPEHSELISAYSRRWHEMVPGEIAGTAAILQELKAGGVALYAITNFSNEKFAEARTRFPFLATSFQDTVVSAEEKLIKPDPRIFEILFKRNDLAPESAVFIDDSPLNVEAARSVGLEAIHFLNANQLRTDLAEMGFPV